MQAYLISGASHGCVVHLDRSGPIKSGNVPPRIYVGDGDDQQEYLLAAHTGDPGNTADADLYYTPPGLTDIERNEVIAEFIRTTSPWQAEDLPSGIVMF
ncbi:MAG TPA: hypothetical protein VNZ27_08190 [Rhodanobacter sp.]|jgi:hypothetical protein|nr:hypothetical protein [Rhodanobacter sp.]